MATGWTTVVPFPSAARLSLFVTTSIPARGVGPASNVMRTWGCFREISQPEGEAIPFYLVLESVLYEDLPQTSSWCRTAVHKLSLSEAPLT